MRFMMLMYPAIDTDAESWEPSAEDVAAMTRYNEELTQAGVLLSLREPPFQSPPLPTDSFQTDKEGNFRIEGLAPGVKYTVVIVQNGAPAGQVCEGLTVKSGEIRDLGDVRAK